ncbi:MAG: glycogen debranching protein GlgX [Desulfobulbaceae bacterium]|nr:glycogen debranching protein GlgX [Desulfobulbaceae bacterium]
MKLHKVKNGYRHPPGATFDSQGTNFSVFSRQATGAELLLYEGPESLEPYQTITLDPETNKTFVFWHVYVVGLKTGTCYTWRMSGPDDTEVSGCRFNPDKELLDPWSHAVVDNMWDRKLACLPGPSRGKTMRSMVTATDAYDWEGDKLLHHSPEEIIIYELHVGGFTRHESSGVRHPGTYSALIEKIPYLKELGINAVELLPVMAFDEQDVPDGPWQRGLKNFWGYSTHSFFCPHPGYCISPLQGTHLQEFRDMVKALHKAGIALILDVVFNHTAEGGIDGPLMNFKGFANGGFYHLDQKDRRRYRDYTGCGNTVNCNHPVVARYIVECLEFWVREMHVDGFRFDLASVLARGQDGESDYYAPVVWSIEFSRTLARTGLIAEAWDAGGLYQVGGFPGFRWAEWNGRYRDAIRQFIAGDISMTGEVATRLCGSSDLYEPSHRLPINSINFITCHDGFTLWDMVSYNEKHNELNGEDNRDGCDHNLSWNCGIEGETDDRPILSLRKKQAKNFMTTLLLSHGVPMILAGDEVLRSQKGNNNCYCQDNDLGWFDWNLVEQNRDMFDFVKALIAFRKRHPCLMRRRFVTGQKSKGMKLPDITWHGSKIGEPPWHAPHGEVLACTMAGSAQEEDLHIIFNMTDKMQVCEIPQTSLKSSWYRAIDTAAPPALDIMAKRKQEKANGKNCQVQPRSIVVLESRDA